MKPPLWLTLTDQALSLECRWFKNSFQEVWWFMPQDLIGSKLQYSLVCYKYYMADDKKTEMDSRKSLQLGKSKQTIFTRAQNVKWRNKTMLINKITHVSYWLKERKNVRVLFPVVFKFQINSFYVFYISWKLLNDLHSNQ